MFVVTMKSKISKKVYRTIISISTVFLCIGVIFTVCMVLKTPEKTIVCDNGEYSADFRSHDICGFMQQFSKTAGEKVSEKQVLIPFDFNKTFEEYNEIQKHHGLDLSLYKGKECTHAVYELEDYRIDYEKTYVSILVYKDTVVGGHISTYQSGSGMYTFFGE